MKSRRSSSSLSSSSFHRGKLLFLGFSVWSLGFFQSKEEKCSDVYLEGRLLPQELGSLEGYEIMRLVLVLVRVLVLAAATAGAVVAGGRRSSSKRMRRANDRKDRRSKIPSQCSALVRPAPLTPECRAWPSSLPRRGS